MLRELQYRTFDEYMDELRIDFPTQELEGFIEPQQLIKVVQRVTYDLGFRINQTRETFLEVEHHYGRLPGDFELMNFAFIIWKFTEYDTSFLPGLHRESNVVDIPASALASCDNCYVACNCNSCCPDTGEIAPSGPILRDCTRIIQITDIKPDCYCVRDYYHTERLIFRKSRYISPDCDPRCQYRYIAEIKDGHLYIPEIECGKVFISYQGQMVDLDGNLMLLDNPYVNEYYDWAGKKAILQSMHFSGEDVLQKLQYAEKEYREARHRALSYASMPDWGELKKAWQMNRQAAFYKYMAPFVAEHPIILR